MCCGLGGAARGGLLFNQRYAEEFDIEFECVGGIDNNPAAVKDFERLSGTPGTVLDLSSLEQYIAIYGKRPPPGWREATPADIRAAFTRRPDIGVMSTPCKGYTGLLSQSKSETAKYVALNALAQRALWLYLEAWADDPSDFILFENVPRIQTRGRALLDQILQMFEHFGYAANETTHNCGEIGPLHQSRQRFLCVARHREKVPAFLYEPERKPLRAVGELLERFPLPGDPRGGPMHRIPALQWKTWVRLAFVEAGKDWRSLNRLKVEDGFLSDYMLVPERRNDYLGVTRWDESSGAVNGESLPTNGKFAVADPRIKQSAEYSQLGVRQWGAPTGTVTGQSTVGGGAHAIADPRVHGGPRHNHVYRIIPWDKAAQSVTSANGGTGGGVADPRGGLNPDALHGKHHVTPWSNPSRAVIGGRDNGAAVVADPRTGWKPGAHESKLRVSEWDKPSRSVTGSDRVGSGALSVADPRPGYGPSAHHHALRITPWEGAAGTVTASRSPGSGAICVQDPRPACLKREGDNYQTAGHYGVIPWGAHAYAVTGAGSHDNGYNCVADPRMPEATQKLVCLIRSLDGTWHRPFTTLELAGLQGLVSPEELFGGGFFKLEGDSDSAWRERTGNAIPSPTMAEIFRVMAKALIASRTGETFKLASDPVWVRPVAVAISVAT